MSAQGQSWQKDAADQNFDYMFKLLIIGNSSVGKTRYGTCYYASHPLESLDSVCLLSKPATVAGFTSKHTESRLSSGWDGQ